MGRGVREYSWRETSKQEQVRDTEHGSQNQEMLRVEVWEGVVFRQRREDLFLEGFSCPVYSPKQPRQPAPTPAQLPPTCRARRQLRPQGGGPPREAQEWEEGFRTAGCGGRAAKASWGLTDRSWMGQDCDRLILPCLSSWADCPGPELSRVWVKLAPWSGETAGVWVKQSEGMRDSGQDTAHSPLPSSCANSITH